jgi:trehalose-6-phosphate synthase
MDKIILKDLGRWVISAYKNRVGTYSFMVEEKKFGFCDYGTIEHSSVSFSIYWSYPERIPKYVKGVCYRLLWEVCHYRLLCNDTNEYLHTGYNETFKDLKESYIDLVEPEIEDEDIAILRSMKQFGFISHLNSVGYTVEFSFQPFKHHE